MTWFQTVTLPLIALLFIRDVRRIVRRGTPPKTATIGAVFWLLAACAVYYPEVTTFVANTLGIGRGADLVSYGLLLIFPLCTLYFYNRLNRLESEITLIVRHLALTDLKTPERRQGPDSNPKVRRTTANRPVSVS